MKKLYIIGAGGFGREVQMLVEQINVISQEWELTGFVDDGIAKGTLINELPVIGSVDEFAMSYADAWAVMALGNPSTKMNVTSQLSTAGIRWATLIHPSVIMGPSRYLSIGEGTIICAGNILTIQVAIGRHVILNLGCTVGHDAVIGDYSSFMPSVNISGEVSVGEGVYVGTGAKINNRITIGEGTVIGSGAVVVNDLPAGCTAVGVPAKPIKFHR